MLLFLKLASIPAHARKPTETPGAEARTGDHGSQVQVCVNKGQDLVGAHMTESLNFWLWLGRGALWSKCQYIYHEDNKIHEDEESTLAGH